MGIIRIVQGKDWKHQAEVWGSSDQVKAQVQQIIQDIVEYGDKALKEYTQKFDQVSIHQFLVSQEEMKKAHSSLSKELCSILEESIHNVRSFHQEQLASSWKKEFQQGTVLGQIVTPIDRVGVYIPGGQAVYPSSAIMNIVPAQIAGVSSIAVVSPPGSNGLPDSLVLASCFLLGINEVYSIGGAQSIAALAYGTESIPSVYKITGPGNQYVAEAKRQVFGKVGIDSFAGPSEILILHDDPSISEEFLVRDLLSQAEHDANASSTLITTSEKTAYAVAKRLEKLVSTLPRKEIIEKSIREKGTIILVDTIEEGIQISNELAPEHLEFLVQDDSKISQIRNAGAIFVGPWSSETIGDYWAGPNHTLPTSGTAKYASPLGVYDFQKTTSLIHFSKEQLLKDGEKIAKFADLEQLPAHAEAVRSRLDYLKREKS